MKKIFVFGLFALVSACGSSNPVDDSSDTQTSNISGKTFIELCEDTQLSGEARHTVDQMKASIAESASTEGIVVRTCSDIFEFLQDDKDLDLQESRIVDVRPITTLPFLTRLSLHDNYIEDFSSLSSLRNLKLLGMTNNPSQECPLSNKDACFTDEDL